MQGGGPHHNRRNPNAADPTAPANPDHHIDRKAHVRKRGNAVRKGGNSERKVKAVKTARTVAAPTSAAGDEDTETRDWSLHEDTSGYEDKEDEIPAPRRAHAQAVKRPAANSKPAALSCQKRTHHWYASHCGARNSLSATHGGDITGCSNVGE